MLSGASERNERTRKNNLGDKNAGEEQGEEPGKNNDFFVRVCWKILEFKGVLGNMRK